MSDDQLDFFNLTRSSLGNELSSRFGVPAYRASQIFQWVYHHNLVDVEAMSNLGRELRSAVRELVFFPQAHIRERKISSDGSRKYLVEVNQRDLVECVMIKQPRRMTLCVSSQVGCGMGCKFCRTATMGFVRNLSTSEILQQVRLVQEDAKNFGDSFHNIVFMGMGEPLHNFENVARTAEVLTDQYAFGFSPKRITISTVGLVPAIQKFNQLAVPASLAVSLNATTNQVRSEIMPINRRFPLEQLLEVLREFKLHPRRKITIEYVLLKGVNDSPEDMRRLPGLLRDIAVKVNLIPYNENAGLGYKAPSSEKVAAWQDYLTKHGVRTTVRWSKGQDIDAACGQLAVKELQ